MNKIIAFICCLALSKAAVAQKDSLAMDDHGKYVYYTVVSMDRLSADTLYNRSLHFFEKNGAGKDFKITARDNKSRSISGSGSFIVYKASLAKHPDGQITYSLKLESKDAKYRYWLSDFVYQPYFRDRYNNYVPDKGIEIPLEKASKTINEKDLTKYLDETAMYARQLGNSLRKSLLTQSVRKIRLDTTRRIHIDKKF